MDRHHRQSKLAQVGDSGQARIGRAQVDLGLEGFAGEVAARYLAGAGVGCVRVRDERTASAARAVDPSVRVEVAPSIPAAQGEAIDLHDPVACDLARGARAALRALRATLEGPS
jgi:hypothetical protein